MGVIRNPIRASTHGFIVNPFGDEAMSLFGIEVKGRTLVNLLGVDGNFEVDSNADGVADGWTNNIAAPAVGALSTTNVKYGTKAQKITSTATEATAWRYTRRPISYVAGNYYLVLVDAITDGTSLATLRAYYNDVSGTLYASSTTSKTLYCKLLVTSNTTGSFVDLVNNNSIGTVGWVQFDGLRLYEITQATYNLIDVDPAYTGEQLAAKFPYVNSVQFKRDVMVRTLTSDGLTEISAAHIPQKIAQDESVWVFGNRAVYLEKVDKDTNLPLASPIYRRIALSAGSNVRLLPGIQQIEQRTGIVWPGKTDVANKYAYCVDLGVDVVNPVNTGQDNWSQSYFNSTVGVIPDSIVGRAG